jgi:hypothetical protein
MKRNNSIIYIFLIFIAFLNAGARTSHLQRIYGKWKIERIVFVEPPDSSELAEAWETCENKIVSIMHSSFIFNDTDCFLFKTDSNFKITAHFFMKKEEATKKMFYDKTIEYLFNDGAKKEIEVFETNYTFKSDEGEVPPLEIIYVNKNHIIINQDENIVYLKKIANME